MTNNDVDSLQFNSLVEHYLAKKVENLPLVKKLAIDQAVSFQYEWFIHKYMRTETAESFDFATYVCLIQAEPKFYGNYIEAMLENHDIPEATIEKCLQHIRSGILPYSIWINKVVSDIKGSDYYSKASIPGMLLVYLCKTMRTSVMGYLKLHKALTDLGYEDKAITDVIDTAYAMFMDLPKDWKEAYMRMFNSEDPALQRKFWDNELTLFTETLIDMTQYPLNIALLEAIENGTIPTGSTFWDEPMMKPAPITNRSRTPIESAEKPAEDNSNGGMTDFRSMFNDNDSIALIQDILDDEEATVVDEEPKEFVVEKVRIDNGGNKRPMSRKVYPTREEAEQFIEDAVDAVPDVINYFSFTINGELYQLKRDRERVDKVVKSSN